MSKSKRGPSFLEVIRKSAALNQEAGADANSSVAAPPVHRAPTGPSSGDGVAAKPASDALAVRTQAAASFNPTVSIGSPATAPPVMGLRGDRLVIALSSLSAGVVMFLFISLIGAGYLLGVRVGKERGIKIGYQTGIEFVRADSADEISAARRLAPNPDIFDEGAASPIKKRAGSIETGHRDESDSTVGGRTTHGKTASANPASRKPSRSRTPPLAAADSTKKNPAAFTGTTGTNWVKGYTYIIVQEFQDTDLDDARKARQFLADRGIEAVVLESSGKYRYRLVATMGFNCDDTTQRKRCEQYHERIREIGEDFVKAGGRYGLQGYQKKLTGEGW